MHHPFPSLIHCHSLFVALVHTFRAYEQVLEETETRIAELKKDAYEFKRDVVVGGENPRTGRTVAEKVCKTAPPPRL